MGRIKETFINDLGETTHATVFKGRTKQISKLHVTQLIPYISVDPDKCPASEPSLPDSRVTGARPKRRAAQESQKKTYEMLNM